MKRISRHDPDPGIIKGTGARSRVLETDKTQLALFYIWAQDTPQALAVGVNAEDASIGYQDDLIGRALTLVDGLVGHHPPVERRLPIAILPALDVPSGKPG